MAPRRGAFALPLFLWLCMVSYWGPRSESPRSPGFAPSFVLSMSRSRDTIALLCILDDVRIDLYWGFPFPFGTYHSRRIVPVDHARRLFFLSGRNPRRTRPATGDRNCRSAMPFTDALPFFPHSGGSIRCTARCQFPCIGPSLSHTCAIPLRAARTTFSILHDAWPLTPWWVFSPVSTAPG